MTSYSQRQLAVIGLAGVIVVAVLVIGALQYDKLPFLTASKVSHSAYFADSSGIDTGAPVQVSGFQVGAVTGVELDGARVLITFNVDESIPLGDRTEAAIEAKSLLGSKVLELDPRGGGQLRGPIPMDRTTPAYELPDALGDLAQTIDALNTGRLNDSLTTLAHTFKDTPPQFKTAVEGLSRFSQALDERDDQLRNLLANANKSTSVLAERSDQVVGLIVNTNALLAQLQTESSALDEISGNVSALSRQLSGFVADNRGQLHGALDKLNGVLSIVDGRKERIQKSIKLLNAYAMSLGESVSSGPFFKAYVANLLPGQFAQPFIDSAFSDLGLDPNVLLPSQRVDPPTGQPGTPALPVPYPRTGLGGEPNTTLPDAITGNPGDPRYPYREPLPAPPAGGPPPGPPAPAPPDLASVPEPTPSPVYTPAPGEVAPAAAGHEPTTDGAPQ
jgi:phospholipid/cholesterol/gamma-HCH transport system substrate-binding protein